MSILAVLCLLAGFVVLLLTFTAGGRLESLSGPGGEGEEAKWPADVPPDPFRTKPYVPARRRVPWYVSSIILGALGCLLMLDPSTWATWIGLGLSLVGFYHGGSEVMELTGMRLFGKASYAAVGVILSLTAAGFHIFTIRGIAPY